MNNDFDKFAVSRGISTTKMDDYKRAMDYVNPYVIEERQLSVTTIDVFSRLQMDRIIFLGDEISSDVSNIVIAQLLWLDQQSNNDITIICNSPGGSVYDGLAIIDTMKFINSDVSTNVVGLAASMAAVISSSGAKGKRYILPHSRFMIHQPLTTGTGKAQASDLEIHAKELLKLREEIYDILCENSGLAHAEIEKMADRDNWLTAQEAIEYGFMDEIIEKKNIPNG